MKPLSHTNADSHIGDTIRIRRPPRVFTDELGHNIWMSDVEPCELELLVTADTDPYDKGMSFDR